nr:MAG TPA: hypothetical protein [Caudoviricetes sp.]
MPLWITGFFNQKNLAVNDLRLKARSKKQLLRNYLRHLLNT